MNTGNFFEFELEHPTVEVKKLKLFAPTNVHKKLTGVMQTMLIKAMNGMAPEREYTEEEIQRAKDDSSTDIDGETLVMALMMGKGQDEEFYSRFCEKFESLLISVNICKINDTDKCLQIGHYNMMNQRDTDKLMGEYLVNFLLPSVFSQKIS